PRCWRGSRWRCWPHRRSACRVRSASSPAQPFSCCRASCCRCSGCGASPTPTRAGSRRCRPFCRAPTTPRRSPCSTPIRRWSAACAERRCRYSPTDREPPGSVGAELRQHLRAGHRTAQAERAEIAFAQQRRLQQLVILPPRQLDRTEGLEVIGHELGVEQLEAAGLEPRHQVHERDLGGIARAVKHALAEEGAAERDAVEAADQRLVLVDLEAVAMPPLVQLAVELADALVD